MTLPVFVDDRNLYHEKTLFDQWFGRLGKALRRLGAAGGLLGWQPLFFAMAMLFAVALLVAGGTLMSQLLTDEGPGLFSLAPIAVIGLAALACHRCIGLARARPLPVVRASAGKHSAPRKSAQAKSAQPQSTPPATVSAARAGVQPSRPAAGNSAHRVGGGTKTPANPRAKPSGLRAVPRRKTPAKSAAKVAVGDVPSARGADERQRFLAEICAAGVNVRIARVLIAAGVDSEQKLRLAGDRLLDIRGVGPATLARLQTHFELPGGHGVVHTASGAGGSESA